MKRKLAFIIAASMIIFITGCSTDNKTDLMEGIPVRAVDVLPDTEAGRTAAASFSVELFKNSMQADKNTLLSTVSVLYALTMTANGADGETRAQMEAALGMPIDELNGYLLWYMDELPQGEKYQLKPANSIWFTEHNRFTPDREFLQANADYYHADIYSAPFDSSTLREINHWVKDKTDGMIPSILDDISSDAVMYLINALAFEAEWQNTYNEHQVRMGEFTSENGRTQTVDFMYCDLGRYLKDELASGFVKHYANSSYAFAALLPNEGVTVEEYVSSLTGDHLLDLLDNAERRTVYTSLPRFRTEFSAELSDTLKVMGITDAFDSDKADFSRLGTSSSGNIFISRVLHRTFIEVGPQGTKAGAATVVEMVDGAAPEQDKEEPVYVYLDRPFIYMIIDCQNNIPVFIGTVMSITD